MHRTFTLSLLVASTVVACARRPADAPAAPDPSSSVAAVGDTLRLMVGQRGTYDGGRLTVRFDSLVGDSRCPKGKVCVWAGDAAVALTITTPSATGATTLHTGLAPRAATISGYTLTLVDVTPYPGTEPENARLAPVTVLHVSQR